MHHHHTLLPRTSVFETAKPAAAVPQSHAQRNKQFSSTNFVKQHVTLNHNLPKIALTTILVPGNYK